MVLLPLCLIIWLRRRLLERAKERRVASEFVIKAEEMLHEHRIIADMEVDFHRP